MPSLVHTVSFLFLSSCLSNILYFNYLFSFASVMSSMLLCSLSQSGQRVNGTTKISQFPGLPRYYSYFYLLKVWIKNSLKHTFICSQHCSPLPHQTWFGAIPEAQSCSQSDIWALDNGWTTVADLARDSESSSWDTGHTHIIWQNVEAESECKS